MLTIISVGAYSKCTTLGPTFRCWLSADRGGWGAVLLLLGPARACHAGVDDIENLVWGDTVGRMEDDGSMLYG